MQRKHVVFIVESSHGHSSERVHHFKRAMHESDDMELLGEWLEQYMR